MNLSLLPCLPLCLILASASTLVKAQCGDTGPACVSDCSGLADGDYQSCLACEAYVTCSGEVLYDMRPCAPSGGDALVWDDNKKRCDYSSDTCLCSPDEVNCTIDTGDRCVSDCVGREDGDYQSCSECTSYVSCVGGFIIEDRACPAPLVWDDDMKRCEWNSPTCTEPTCVEE